jgi:hypothetical protein
MFRASTFSLLKNTSGPFSGSFALFLHYTRSRSAESEMAVRPLGPRIAALQTSRGIQMDAGEILIIEDEQDARELLGEILRFRGSR